MRKFIALLFLSLSISCINPSMENGFARLIESLKQLTASFEALNVDQISTDMQSIVTDLEYIAQDLNSYNLAMIEYQSSINEYHEATIAYTEAMNAAALAATGTLYELEALVESGNQWAGLYLQIMKISQSFSEIQTSVDNMATSAQVEAISQQLQGMHNDLVLSIQGSDVDGDGIIHMNDKCPTLAGPESNNGCPLDN